MMEANAIKVRIGELCHQFRLPTMGAQSVSRFTAAGHGDALETLLEVLEQEAEDRRQRRIGRLRTASRLPAGKTWETFEHHRVPLALRQQLGELSDGSFVDRGVNVLAFGLPGTGKTHALCAVGHRLVEAGRSVLFAPAYRLVQDLLAAKRDLALPRQLRKLDNYDFLLLDDLGYLPQGAEESEVLFTLIAERYERRSLGITSNLVFSQWEHIFANPMATAAAIDRVAHHSVPFQCPHAVHPCPSVDSGLGRASCRRPGRWRSRICTSCCRASTDESSRREFEPVLSCCSSVLGSLRILVLHVFDANEPATLLKPQSSGQFHMEAAELENRRFRP